LTWVKHPPNPIVFPNPDENMIQSFQKFNNAKSQGAERILSKITKAINKTFAGLK